MVLSSRPRAFRCLLAVATVALVMTAGACSAGDGAASGGGGGGGSGTPAGTSGTGGSATSNGTKGGKDVATWALGAGAYPDWIFPMIDSGHSTVINRNQFQYLMYRPLYWYGKDGEPVVNESLSLAEPPKYGQGDKSVTLTLKNYKWSNGESVTAQDVEFWLNMLDAETSEWAYYVPGGIPKNLKSWKVVNPKTIVLDFKRAYSPAWFTNNELSQITPLPLAWDKTSTTAKGNCATEVSGCAAVWKYLYDQSKNIATYASSPIWSVVDGPWRLTGYQNTGYSKFARNTKYSGPATGNVKEFIEQPFTTDAAELNVLRSNGLSVGYLPATDLAQKSMLAQQGYTLSPAVSAGINYFPENFNNPKVGPIFKQLYFRQAMQHLVNQPEYISQVFQGYASPDYGAVPNVPPSPYLDKYVKDNPYPFSVSAAKSLLTKNGWTVKPGGISTCAKPGTGPGECGAGVTAGEKLELSLLYASGTESVQQEMESMKSTFAEAGIDLNLSEEPFDQVISAAVPCKPSQASCSWEMANWGGGWSYSMDHFPNGDVLFATGAGDNDGNYSNPEADRLITKTDTVPGTIHAAENFLASNLPVIFMPKGDSSLTEIAKNLQGVNPQEPTYNITPEDWTFTGGS